MDGLRMDDGACLYYKLPGAFGSDELTRSPLKMLADNWHVTFGQAYQITLISRISLELKTECIIVQV